MRMRKFEGSSIKDVVTRVKEELGPDAIIVSTRTRRRGLRGTSVEVTAALDAPELGLEVPTAITQVQPLSVSHANSLSATHLRSPTAIQMMYGGAYGEPVTAETIEPLYSELRAIRDELTPLRDSVSQGDIRSEIHALRQLIHRSQVADSHETPSYSALERTVRAHHISTPSNARIIAVVGPTGVGKSTTLAKLAARRALLKGERVALVTTDTYRVGGEEQMRIFADLIGCPMFTVTDPKTLYEAVQRLDDYDSIFIDTASRLNHAKETEMVSAAIRYIAGAELHLVVPADSRASQIDRWFHRVGDDKVDRLLFTKVDEAFSLTQLVEAPARLKCPVSFVTTGQRIPEDLVLATSNRLLAMASEGIETKEEVAA